MPKHSLGVHCYMGMTYWGVTNLKSVTGTHKRAQKHINLKTKRAFTGVGSKEYMFCSSISSQNARDCSSKLAGRHTSGSYSRTMLQLIRPRNTCNASATMSQEGFSWNGLPTHLICLPLKISRLGWSSSWVTERALTILLTCNVGCITCM